MAFPERIAEHLTYSFIKETLPHKEEKELERIEYGLALFFIALPKFIALLALALLVNSLIKHFFIYFMVTLLSYAVVRAYAWGLHLKGDMSCFIGSLLLLFGNTFASIFFHFPLYLLLIFWGFSSGFLYLYAPADTEARPLRSQTLRKKLRSKLMIVAVTLFIITIVYRNHPYSSLITLGVFWESVFTTPYMYKLLKIKGGRK